MNTRRRPNTRLRALLAETRWTGQEFASTVNKIGAEAGVPLRYDRTSVSHWLSGIQPRPPAPVFIAEALTQRLNRPVSVTDAGLDLLEPRDPVAARPAGPAGAPSGTVPTEAALTGPDVLETAESIGRALSACDSAFGGGAARHALAGYLTHDLVPRLTAQNRPEIRARLHEVAGQLAYLCGFMCFDDEIHDEAQRYYQMALSLATEAADQTGYAVTLRAMSVQARLLGHRSQAVHLAEGAVAAGRAADPRRQAFLHGQLAVAHAAHADRDSALTVLATAERLLDRATSTGMPLTGAYHPASLAHQQAAVRALLGDSEGAAGALASSIRHRPAAERRARAITRARLAELQFGNGHLDEAVQTWHEFLEDYRHLSSGRAGTALALMQSTLRPHSRHQGVPPLLTHAAVLRWERPTAAV